MVFVVRHRETRELDGVGDAIFIDEGNGRKTLPNLNLPPLYVIVRQEGVGGPRGGVTVLPAASITKCSTVSPAQMPRT
jgi:hypothetical protein